MILKELRLTLLLPGDGEARPVVLAGLFLTYFHYIRLREMVGQISLAGRSLE
jgi:hypothetical protein